MAHPQTCRFTGLAAKLPTGKLFVKPQKRTMNAT